MSKKNAIEQDIVKLQKYIEEHKPDQYMFVACNDKNYYIAYTFDTRIGSIISDEMKDLILRVTPTSGMH